MVTELVCSFLLIALLTWRRAPGGSWDWSCPVCLPIFSWAEAVACVSLVSDCTCQHYLLAMICCYRVYRRGFVSIHTGICFLLLKNPRVAQSPFGGKMSLLGCRTGSRYHRQDLRGCGHIISWHTVCALDWTLMWLSIPSIFTRTLGFQQ